MAEYYYIQVARVCNQKCLFCSNPDNGEMIQFGKIKKLLRMYKKNKAAGVIWTGGEPTLYPRLAEAITYAKKLGLENKLITNSQKICDEKLMAELAAAGLRYIHFSVYSHLPKLQAFLTNKKDSLKNVLKALAIAKKFPIDANLSVVINKYNSAGLDKTAYFFLKKFPHIRHFVFNNLDASSLKRENLHTKPRLKEYKKSLANAVKIIEKSGRTVRVERVPLCAMPGFEHLSTETRALAKGEARKIYFLDKREMRYNNDGSHEKFPVCRKCSLDKICAGLQDAEILGESADLKAQTKDPRKIIGEIKND